MVHLVKSIMTTNVVTVHSSEKILDAAKIMSEKKIGCLVVLENGRAAGIITERDILRRVVAKSLDPTKVSVVEIMSKPLITVSPDDSVRDAARIMVKNKIRRLPVVEGLRLIGIVTSTDLAKYLIGYRDTLEALIPLEGTPEVAENHKSCSSFKADPYLDQSQVWEVCGACYWFIDEHCIREPVRLLKHL